jgi:hypothetical protein
MTALLEAPLARTPFLSELAMMSDPVARSLTNISATPFVSLVTKLEPADVKAAYRPLAEKVPAELIPLL